MKTASRIVTAFAIAIAIGIGLVVGVAGGSVMLRAACIQLVMGSE